MLETISKVVASSNVQFRELEKQYKKIIPFLHVESKYFKSRAFLEAFHAETSKSGLKVANKKVKKFLAVNSDIAKKVIYCNSSELLEVGFIGYSFFTFCWS